jgi:hypothetical protein
MKLEAKELRDAVAYGVRSLLGRWVSLTDERNEDPHPEYLTTAAVAFSLGDFARKKGLAGKLRIRCEKKTNDLWLLGSLKVFMKQVSAAIRPVQKADFRSGNVDITLFDGSGFEQPFSVIENKGLLKFGADGEIYTGHRNEVVKDLKRNAAFITGLGAVDGINYSAFTFYLRDNDSSFPEHADAYKAKKKAYFEKLVDGLGLDPSLKRNVLIDTWDHGLFSSKQEAEEPDEYGQPAIDSQGTWHLLYGVISLYKPGGVVLDTARLSDQ